MKNGIYSIDELRDLVKPIAKQYDISKVYLFGSYAKGLADENSDVDICIDASEIKGFFAIGGIYSDLSDALKKDVDLITLGSLDYCDNKIFVNNVRKDSILIYERPKH